MSDLEPIPQGERWNCSICREAYAVACNEEGAFCQGCVDRAEQRLNAMRARLAERAVDDAFEQNRRSL